MAETFLSAVDTEKVQALMNDTNENVNYFNTITMETARRYTENLDRLMDTISESIKASSCIDTDTLEDYYLELSNEIYFMGEKLEQLGIYDDMSRSAQKEVFNRAYLANQIKDSEKKNKTTVAENTAVAEAESQYESVVNSIYNRACKIVKFKVDAAQDMVNTLRKVISRRMAEVQLTAFGSSKFVPNKNEEVFSDD